MVLTFVLQILVYRHALLMEEGGEKDPSSNISAAIQDRDNISTATPPFS